MQQPWGLSGPQFLVLFSIAFPVSVLLVFGARSLAGRLPSKGMGRQLTPYELAYLAGGAKRVLVTGVAELLSSGRVHRSRDGRLTTDRAYPFSGPMEKAVARNMIVAARWRDRIPKFRADPALRAMLGELRAGGQLPTAGGRVGWTIVVLLPVAVWVTGLVRAINGAALNRPIGDLEVLLEFSGVILIFVVVWWCRRAARPSAHGAVLLRRARNQYQSRGTYRHVSSIPLNSIAVLGTVGVADAAMLGLMGQTAPAGSGGYGGSSGCASGGCGGGGGGGCGGGGGGGGCGG